MAREKYLEAGLKYDWAWRDPRTLAIASQVHVEVSVESVEISYRLSKSGEYCRSVVQLVTTPCHYGKYRYWFLCPECRGRVAHLYMGAKVACRRCHQLVYKVQRESTHNREVRRLDKMRIRLGWSPGFLNPDGCKPKGMHWATYWPMVNEHARLVRSVVGTIDGRMEAMAWRLALLKGA